MSIEGVLEFDAVRDYLYQKMRGAKGEHLEGAAAAEMSPGDEALVLLREIRDALKRAGGRAGA
jgi:putative membrane protein